MVRFSRLTERIEGGRLEFPALHDESIGFQPLSFLMRIAFITGDLGFGGATTFLPLAKGTAAQSSCHLIDEPDVVEKHLPSNP